MPLTPQKEIAELAVKKAELRAQLKEMNDRIKILAREVDFPFCIEADGHAVMVRRPPGYGQDLPVVTISPLLH